jgi:pimeloyl-ACP methyl ester carboxylesterase
VATYVLIPGAGADPFLWDRVTPLLERAGHRVVTPALPTGDDSATFSDYADHVIAAVGTPVPDDLIVVGQSLGGFTAPIVAARLPVRLLVLLAAMVPAPGETGGEWWTNTQHGAAYQAAAERDGRSVDGDFDEVEIFFHDVPPEVTESFLARGEPVQSEGVFAAPWPLAEWPHVPTRFLLCRDDRFFPADFQRRVVRERLGFVPDEMPGGHLAMLSQPDELVERLEGYRAEVDVR